MQNETNLETLAPSDRLVPVLAERLGASACAAAVFGEPIERDGVTIVPVARVRYGFGGGGGAGPDGRGAGSGGGGGAMSSPAGFIEIRGDTARFRPIAAGKKLLLSAVAGAVAGMLIARVLSRTP